MSRTSSSVQPVQPPTSATARAPRSGPPSGLVESAVLASGTPAAKSASKPGASTVSNHSNSAAPPLSSTSTTLNKQSKKSSAEHAGVKAVRAENDDLELDSTSPSVPRAPDSKASRAQMGVLPPGAKDRPLLELAVRVQQTATRLKVTYTVRNTSAHEAYLQNRFGPTRECEIGRFGGGVREANVREANDRKGATPDCACTWTTADGTLVLFQGDVPCGQSPAPPEWSEPAYSKVARDETKFEIELGLPIRQWENNLARDATGPSVKVKRIALCVEALLDPLSVIELDAAQGIFACDYGQPGYLEAIVDLDKAVEVITVPGLESRGEAKLSSLLTLVCLGGTPPKST